MTCEVCEGAGVMPIVDVWRWVAKTKQEKKTLPMPIIEGCPCPECSPDDAIGFIKALVDKHGEPFSDTEIGMIATWTTPDGRRVLVAKPIETEDC